MPPFPEEMFLEAISKLVAIDKEWIPRQKGSTLYIRPLMFATDEFVGVRASEKYKFLSRTC
jgi:branched-chain amino acid aminotransferase